MRIFFILLCAFVLAPPSYAQETSAPASAQEQIDQLLGEEKEQASAPQTLNDYAFDALQKCLQTEHPILQGENLEAMCGCASDNFTEAIDLKAAQNMYQQTADGRFDHYRMMMFAYAPCVKEVVQRTVLEDCANNKKNRYLMKNLRATCSCIATRVSDAMNRLAPKLIEGDIAHKRYFRNPVDVLIKPDAFNRYLRHASPQCVDIHERRKR